MNDSSSEQQGPQGPGKVAVWIVLLVALIGMVIGINYMAPWMQDMVNSAPGAEAGSPSSETTTE